MCVISGKYRGIKLDGYDIDGTRPTMDRVKESMFAMIQSYVKDAIVLDLFAGSGNLGIEAMSNGSKEVYFVDHNKIAITTIQNNLKKLHATESYHLMQMDYQRALQELKQQHIQFNLVLLDPPYKKQFINNILEILVNYDLLKEEAIVVCEFDEEEIASEILTCIKEKKYGNKYVKVYQKK